MWIDSHCHLNHKGIAEYGGVDKLVDNAADNHVDGMVTICCRLREEPKQLLDITHQFDHVWCTVGTHPHEASHEEEKAVTLDELVTLAKSDEKIVGIGESGLDYYYDFATPEDQDVGFRKHIQACIETDLPLIVHARDADEDVARIIREEGAGTKLKGVMHCFSSGRKLAEDMLDFGFYISLSGIVTFKNATELQDIARDVPLDRLLVETDAPFLAPMPYRGKTNQPAFVGHTGAFAANLKDIPVEEMAEITTRNFFRLFDKARLV